MTFIPDFDCGATLCLVDGQFPPVSHPLYNGQIGNGGVGDMPVEYFFSSDARYSIVHHLPVT